MHPIGWSDDLNTDSGSEPASGKVITDSSGSDSDKEKKTKLSKIDSNKEKDDGKKVWFSDLFSLT